MHDIAGLVALVAIGLWIAYLVPHRLRYRQQLLESRTEDRFSEALRVLAVTDVRRRGERAVEARAECGPDSPKRSGLLSPARGVPVGGRTTVLATVSTGVVTEGKGGVVERPYGTQDKLSADDARRTAQERARRAAALARRAAAARRRAVLTAVLLVASAAAWVVVGLTPVGLVAGLVPTVLLGGVLVLGRRAVLAGQAADAAWERRRHERTLRPAGVRARVTGRAQHPSDSRTEALAQVGAAASGERSDATATGAVPVAAPAADGASGSAPADEARSTSDVTDGADTEAAEPSTEGWSPVPVPRPTYTTKATAPRREPVPLVVDEPAAAVEVEAPADATSDGDEGPTPSLDLDAILARRRAAGE